MDNGELSERRSLIIRCYSGPTLSIFHYPFSICSVEFLQVHTFVHTRDVFAVAVEGQSLSAQEFADAPFGGLRPARVVDFGIYIRIEAVFLGLHLVPRSRWFFLDEAYFNDRLDAFEAVLPGHD